MLNFILHACVKLYKRVHAWSDATHVFCICMHTRVTHVDCLIKLWVICTVCSNKHMQFLATVRLMSKFTLTCTNHACVLQFKSHDQLSLVLQFTLLVLHFFVCSTHKVDFTSALCKLDFTHAACESFHACSIQVATTWYARSE